MAKISIDVDTSDKSVAMSVDGNKIENLSEIVIYTDDGPFGFLFEAASREKNNDLSKITRLVAKETEDSEPSQYDGLYEEKDKSHLSDMLEKMLLR